MCTDIIDKLGVLHRIEVNSSASFEKRIFHFSMKTTFFALVLVRKDYMRIKTGLSRVSRFYDIISKINTISRIFNFYEYHNIKRDFLRGVTVNIKSF